MLVLDTHAWVYWVDGSGLSPRARRTIDAEARTGKLAISSISAWEVALLAAKGRLRLKMGVAEWIRRSEAIPFVQFVPVDNGIAIRSTQLPEPFHPDPADRIIVATALELDAPVVTADRKILDYQHVRSLW